MLFNYAATCLYILSALFMSSIYHQEGHNDASLKLSWSCHFSIFPGKSLNENLCLTWFLPLYILHPTHTLHTGTGTPSPLRRGEQDPLVASPGGDLGCWSQWLVSAVITISDSVEPLPCRGEHQHQHQQPWPSCWHLCLCQVCPLF